MLFQVELTLFCLLRYHMLVFFKVQIESDHLYSRRCTSLYFDGWVWTWIPTFSYPYAICFIQCQILSFWSRNSFFFPTLYTVIFDSLFHSLTREYPMDIPEVLITNKCSNHINSKSIFWSNSLWIFRLQTTAQLLNNNIWAANNYLSP